MEELGKRLKEAREENGVTVKEAAEDLKFKPSEIEKIELGNVKAFKDVFYLKCLIRDYSKYLGLDDEKIMDEVNEYFFTATSKIPIEEIKKASQEREKEKKQEPKVISPYTMVEKPKSKVIPIIVSIIIIVLLSLIGYIVVTEYVNPNYDENTMISYIER